MYILLVEDERDQREIVASILEANHHTVAQADGVESAIVRLKADQELNRLPDVVFSDWKLGTLTGLNLLDYVRNNKLPIGFVVATAYGSVQHAVQAIEKGADDYLSKPFQSQELLLAISKAQTSKTLKLQNQKLENQLSEQRELVDLVGNAPCMQAVYERIKRISKTSATVLINGESGTGKELAARALFQLSERSNEAFIAINCGAIPETLAEAELFGAEKGAFTGATETKIGKIEAANLGTLFLDEIGELPLLLQTKLLRFLQEGVITRLGSHQEIKVDVRVIAATHVDLEQAIIDKSFREDLFYRLNVVPIKMPPLRERKEDIPSLIEHFVRRFEQHYQVSAVAMDTDTKRELYDYQWPGNVRELSNKIERYVLLGDPIELNRANSAKHKEEADSAFGFIIPEEGLLWEEFEADVLKQSLAMTKSKSAAAKLLGLNYKQFLYRLEKFNIE